MQPVFAPRTTTARVSPRLAAVLALTLIPAALIAAFTYAPTSTIALVGDSETLFDFPQKIFYIHVPIAFAAYLCFAAGAWNGVLYLWRGEVDYDIRSYAGVHSGMVFGTLVLVTGSIWARAAWGVWWQWKDRQLLVFLILFLFYAAYFMVRFSIDEPKMRARVSAIYSILGVALVPLSFMAIRIADTLIHPIVLKTDERTFGNEIMLTFAVSVVGFAALAIWMLQLEVVGKLRAMRGYGATDSAEALTNGTGIETEAVRKGAPNV